jgi:hypothetical protein
MINNIYFSNIIKEKKSIYKINIEIIKYYLCKKITLKKE